MRGTDLENTGSVKSSEWVTFDGNAIAYVLSANNERRHLSMPERAAATALTLATDGKRENGRWERGAVKGTEPTNSGSANNSWSCRMRDAGLVFDYLGAERLKHVANGQEALDAAAQINSMPTTTQLRLSLALG